MKIVLFDNTKSSVLTRRAKPVGKVTAEIAALMDQMLAAMRAASGVGLAAPQVGVGKRIFVVEYEEKIYQLADPELIEMSGEEMGREGCLSLPGLICDVRRASRVVLRGRNRRGRRVTVHADGWLARVFQHEMDHLDGVLMTDRVDDPIQIHRIEDLEREDASAATEAAV
ncbi:MAG: peptide deformylase [Armatimonadetes bacterium]|nr:peptide deformylase [Armatimonadota bacterium]